MNSIIVLLALAQVVVQPAATTQVRPRPDWQPAVTWQEGSKTRRGFVSTSFVAELAPSAAHANALRTLDPHAEVLIDRPQLRIWKVADAPWAVSQVIGFTEVLHELPSTAGPMFVPLGVVCGGQRASMPGLAALTYVTAHHECLPNFWRDLRPM